MRISDWSSDVCSSDLDEMGAFDLEGIQHSDRIGLEIGETIGCRRRMTAAVTARVIPEYVKAVAKNADLLVPHGQVGGDGMGQYQPIATGRSLHLAFKHHGIGTNEQNPSPCFTAEDRKSTRLKSSH